MAKTTSAIQKCCTLGYKEIQEIIFEAVNIFKGNSITASTYLMSFPRFSNHNWKFKFKNKRSMVSKLSINNFRSRCPAHPNSARNLTFRPRAKLGSNSSHRSAYRSGRTCSCYHKFGQKSMKYYGNVSFKQPIAIKIYNGLRHIWDKQFGCLNKTMLLS